MLKVHWRYLIGFVVLMTALSAIVVRHGVDVQFRGYPLPFLTIESGIGGRTSFGWRIPNFLLSLGLYVTAATVAFASSRLHVAAKNWFIAGLGVLMVIGVTTYFIWHSVDNPIERADALDHAVTVSTVMRHFLALGTLGSAVCFLVFFLRLFRAPGRD